ncbi:MAG: ABC transporter substrate-binding protein [Armatimonadota bacterium]|nr:ABC transporter substrate-binding protein [Armatimonadota bacterium]
MRDEMRKDRIRPPLTGRLWPLLVGLALVLTTLPVAAQQPTPRRGGVLRIAHIGEPPTLDQHWTTAAITGHIMHHVNEGLFALNSKFEPKPMLVEKWTTSGDRLTYTFTLRRGIKFHNGKDLTADDVVASLQRWGRIATRGRALFANVVSVTAADPLTVVMKLREPYGLLLVDLALPGQSAVIFPKEVIDEAGTGQVRRFISTGPYRFVEHLPDRHIRLDRFEGYQARTEEPDGATGRKSAYADSIYVIPVPDAAVRIAGVKRGEYHFAETIPSDEYDRLRADRDLVPFVTEVPNWLTAVFNNRQGLMANTKIRQAFQAALDHEAVMRAAYGNRRFWRLDPGLMPKEHYMWTDAGKEFFNQKNPARARQLLAEAGYRGEPVRWITTMEYVAYGTAAQVVKPMLEQAGFTVDLQVVDWATLVQRRARPELWDVFSTAFSFVPDPVFLLALQPTWPGWFDNRDLNAMMTLLRRHADPKVRKEIWARAQKLWYEQAGSIKFGDYFLLHLHRRELKGYVNLPTHVWWNAWLER